jgi:dTDP-4-dehydrorhamnose 3,5-epimerase
VVSAEPSADARGYFSRWWCETEFAAAGLSARIAQISMSHNRRKGNVRGLHFQRAPHAEVKLVRCLRGAIYDVVVDIRPESSTFLQWRAFELNSLRQDALYVPKGFAHGFQTLEDDSDVLYVISEPFAADSAAGMRWDDPNIGIEWPLPTADISDRDRHWPLLDPAIRGAGLA